jgi:hypothetical protein
VLGRTLKVLSILTLLIAVFLGRPSSAGLVAFQFLLCGCACLVVFQAVNSSRYLWAASLAWLKTAPRASVISIASPAPPPHSL